MFPKKSDWTLLYCWNSKQSMWQSTDSRHRNKSRPNSISTHTHKSRITKNSWNSFSSHLSLHFGFFLAQKKRPNNGHAEKSIECRAIENSFVVGQLFMIMPTCSIDRIDPYFSLWCRPFPVFLYFIPVMFLEFALKYFQRRSMKGNPFSIGNQIEREWPFDQQIEQKQMKEERTNVHFIDSNSAGLFREWIEQCTQHKMCQKCLKETWSWFFHNFFVSFPLFGHHFDLIRFCCSFSKCYQIKTENISYFFPFLLLDYFRGRNRNVPFPLCALCSHS